MNKYYHGSAASNKVRMGVDHLQHVCCEFIHVRNRSNPECDDASLACKCSDVAVHSYIDVFTYHQRTLSVRRVFL